jgi:hypothetical protein
MEPPLLLRYQLSYGERPAGKGELHLEATRSGLRAEFKVQNQEGNARWVSEMGPAGDSRRFMEFAGSETVPVFGFKVLPEQGQVRIEGSNKASFPWLGPIYDPLSLLINLAQLEPLPHRVEMAGGHAFAQKLAEESLAVLEHPTLCSVYRLSPGTVLVYLHPQGYPVRILEQRGGHVLSVNLAGLEKELAAPARRRKRSKERK